MQNIVKISHITKMIIKLLRYHKISNDDGKGKKKISMKRKTDKKKILLLDILPYLEDFL
ncbi:hypothetical protein LCGC14_0485480 [marine sediment metagenome]|uniref:Uncharacterized protein n=1 Tax=marine sediment metagenome TaxID=412755 RepID=A0A0F9SDE3_9ZZZZ|nr:MAG: hypothetical protein Lokiarch_06520 [Candidatus Lokiarchaeum sp. GC14_75]